LKQNEVNIMSPKENKRYKEIKKLIEAAKTKGDKEILIEAGLMGSELSLHTTTAMLKLKEEGLNIQYWSERDEHARITAKWKILL
jgi:hypothetical protein